MATTITPDKIAKLITEAIGHAAVEMAEQIQELDLKEAKHEWHDFEATTEDGWVKIGKITLTVSK